VSEVQLFFFQKLPRWLLMGWEFVFCNSLRPRIAKRKSEIEVVIRELPTTND